MESTTPDYSSNHPTTTSPSPWHRIKWTQNMVKLLIMVLFYIGDDTSNTPPSHKKGKWKSVSMAMMDRGFFVSPQQCEDKFNDLNKRYKRVNDILGKGTACRVVQNPALLETMDHLSPKAKDEVRKLLNSKHLFFPEMCAYHNTCPPTTTAHKPQQPPQQQQCLHSTDNGSSKLNDDTQDDIDIDDEDSEFEETRSPSDSQLVAEVMAVMQDGTRSATQKLQWIKTKRMQLEDQRVRLQSRDIDLTKKRLKWLNYSGKKEHEMERERLVNQQMKLENQRMALMLRHKELDFMEAVKQQQQHRN